MSTFFNTCFWPRELTLTAADWIYFEQKQFHELSHSEKLPNFDQLNNKRLNFLFQTCSPLIFIAWLFINIEFRKLLQSSRTGKIKSKKVEIQIF